jgi:hypothetical protein
LFMQGRLKLEVQRRSLSDGLLATRHPKVSEIRGIFLGWRSRP